MAYQLANGSTIEVGATYGTAVAVTGISNAKPAVVTATAHGFAEGDFVVLTSGWSRLNGRTYQLGAITDDTFALVDIDTTNTNAFPAGSGTGSVREVETWTQVPQVTDLAFSGAEQNFTDIQFLEENDQRQIPTFRSASSLAITVADDPAQAYVPLLEAADQDRAPRAWRINQANGSRVLYYAYTSIAPAVLAINELITRTITLANVGLPVNVYATE